MANSESVECVYVAQTAIAAVKIVTPCKFVDHRGYFSETYNETEFKKAGVYGRYVQDNQSLSVAKGAVRGLHFQIQPFAQDKLIRVISGSILDVAVDIRRDSPTFGQHVTAVLSAENGQQIFVPAGFAHGFCTLEPNTEVFYKVTNYYSPEHDRGIIWNDPDIGIDWPVTPEEAILSDKDRDNPRLGDLLNEFLFDAGDVVKGQ